MLNCPKFLKILLNYIFEKFWRLFKFLCKFFINFSKVFDEYIFAECPPPNRNFGDAIAVQDLREIHILYISVQNFVRCPPNQNSGGATVHYSFCMKKRACSLYIFRVFTMYKVLLLALTFRLLYLVFF